jgi:hypothetical protein
MDGLLANIFSSSDVLKRQLKDAVSNPSDYLDMVIARTGESLKETEDLRSRAFGTDDPTVVTDPKALAQLTDKVMNVMPAGVIAGKAGLQAFSKVATPQQLDNIQTNITKAKELRDKGLSFEQQVKQTGFGFGKDNKLRFEVPDTGARLSKDIKDLKENEIYNAGDLLSHPLLYDFYPEFANKQIRIVKDPKSSGAGAFNYKTDTIDLNVASPIFKNPIRAISTALHETQHYVQKAENFLKGSNWKQYLKDKTKFTEADKQKAFEKYMKEYGEVEARNIQFRFEDPLLEKMAKIEGVPYESKVRGKDFTQTMGKDPDTVDVFKRELSPEEFNYSDFFTTGFERMVP